MSDQVLIELTKVLEARKQATADDSYVASLHQKGLNKILEKVGEESIETILAARDAEISGNNDKLIYESSFKAIYLISAVIIALIFYLLIAILFKAFKRSDINLNY